MLNRSLKLAAAAAVCGIFLYGCYALVHFIFGASDGLVRSLLFGVIWAHMTNSVAEDQKDD